MDTISTTTMVPDRRRGRPGPSAYSVLLCMLCAVWLLASFVPAFGQVSRGGKGKKSPAPAVAGSGRLLKIDCGRGGRIQLVGPNPSRADIQQPEYVDVAENVSTHLEFQRGIPLRIAIVPAKGLKVDTFWVDDDIVVAQKSIRVGDKPKVIVPVMELKGGRGIPVLHAKFRVAPVSTIVATAGANGAISPTGIVTVEEGETQLFMVKAAPNYVIADVMVDNKSMGPIPAYAFTNVKGTHTIGALFVLEEEVEIMSGQYKVIPGYSITASSGPNGAINPSGVIPLDEGASQTFQFIPAPMCRVANVIIDGLSLGPMKGYTFHRVIQSHTISVQYMKDPSLFRGKIPDENEGKFTVTSSSSGDGWISPEGTVKAEKGTRLLYTITPVPGNGIQDVLVDGVSQGPVEEYVFPDLAVNHTIEARFAVGITAPRTEGASQTPAPTIRQYYINVSLSPDSGGTVIPGGDVPVNEGDEAEFLIIPNAGYTIGEVFIDGRSIGTVQRYLFQNVDAPHSIEVRFEK